MFLRGKKGENVRGELKADYGAVGMARTDSADAGREGCDAWESASRQIPERWRREAEGEGREPNGGGLPGGARRSRARESNLKVEKCSSRHAQALSPNRLRHFCGSWEQWKTE